MTIVVLPALAVSALSACLNESRLRMFLETGRNACGDANNCDVTDE